MVKDGIFDFGAKPPFGAKPWAMFGTMLARFSAICALAMTLVGCSIIQSIEETIWPSDYEDDDSEAFDTIPSSGETVDVAPIAERSVSPIDSGADIDAAARRARPSVRRGDVGPAPGFNPSDATFVGGRIARIRYDFNGVRAALKQHRDAYAKSRTALIKSQQSYHGLVSAIKSRLSTGTTPSNPILIRQWVEARRITDAISRDLWQLHLISNRIAVDSGMLDYLLQGAQAAYFLPGGVDKDHNTLRIMEGEIEHVRLAIIRFKTNMERYIDSQSRYLNQQRLDMNNLDIAVQKGRFIGERFSNISDAMPPALARSSNGKGSAVSGSLLMVIKSADRVGNYEDSLYQTLQKALDSNPGVRFSIVAVTPAGTRAREGAGNSAAVRRKAEEVMRIMAKMGVPPERTRLIAISDNIADNEIRIFAN